MQKHTILFLAANPSVTSQLALHREVHSIQVELDRSNRHHFEFVTRWAVEPLDLLRALRDLKPTVVHYSGHGSQHGLFFQAPDGGARVVSTTAIAEAFGAAGTSVRLVVLNACYSEVHADALLEHVDCIVGTSGALLDDVARSFAIGLYGGLGRRESVTVAYKQGCAAISLEGFDGVAPPLDARDVETSDPERSIGNERPRLRVRSGIDASQLVLGHEPSSPRPPATRAAERIDFMVSWHARRGLATIVASAGVMVTGIWLMTFFSGEKSPGTTAQEPAPEAPRPSESRPPGVAYLPALELEFGSTDDEIREAFSWCRTLTTPADCRKDLYWREHPAHRVRVSALFLDVHERSTGELATWLSALPGLYKEVGWLVADGVRLVGIGDGRDLRLVGTAIVPRSGTEHLPAVDVTYDGARRFCQARGMDLPTEAQWERAARGMERRRFPWGNTEPTCDRAIYGRGSSGPCPSGARVPVDVDVGDRTPEGIVNLGGNVAEWVIDRYVDGGYVACPAPCIDPIVVPTNERHELHVIRGGAFESLAEQLRGAGRARAPGDAAFGNTGFRCAGTIGRGSQ